MSLIELAEEIKQVIIEIDKEEVDVRKIKSLLSVLKKLIIKFREKALLVDLDELIATSCHLMTENFSDKTSNVALIWKYLFEITIEVQNDEYIDFTIPGYIDPEEENNKKGLA